MKQEISHTKVFTLYDERYRPAYNNILQSIQVTLRPTLIGLGRPALQVISATLSTVKRDRMEVEIVNIFDNRCSKLAVLS